MIQFNKNTILKIHKDLIKLPINATLHLRTYKGDRGFSVTKVNNKTFQMIENGYFDRFYENLSLEETLKILDKTMEREFPRSHKIKYQVK